ncbi:methyltransferase [Spirochaetia bacterium]|nr:methyltransferase [Spirochaetia bacterium]
MDIITKRARIIDLYENIGQIEGVPQNPRQIKKDQFEKLKKSIRDFPDMLSLRELVAYDNSGDLVVIGGNMRLKALRELGIETAEVKILSRDTPIDRLREFTIKDNIGFGEDNWELLANQWEVEELSDWGVSVDWDTPAETTGDDEAPEAGTGEPDSRPGEIYELGKHRLYCGDSTDPETFRRLMGTEKADMCFTSPPYNGNTDLGSMKGPKYQNLRAGLYKNNESDNKSEIDYMSFLWKVLKNLSENVKSDSPVFWNVSYNIKSRDTYGKIIFNENNPFHVLDTVCWYKGGSGAVGSTPNIMYRHAEFIFLLCLGQYKRYSSYDFNYWNIKAKDSNNEDHYACFPVALPVKAITEYSKEGAIVLDTFGGSGTTMIAAEKTGRVCMMIELDCHYIDVIRKRVSAWMLGNGRTKEYIGSGYLE